MNINLLQKGLQLFSTMNNNELEPAQGAPPILRYNLALHFFKKKKIDSFEKRQQQGRAIDHLHKTYDKTKETAKG